MVSIIYVFKHIYTKEFKSISGYKPSNKGNLTRGSFAVKRVDTGHGLMAYPVNDAVASQYKGVGFALAAVTGGQIVALRYVRDVAPAQVVDAVEDGGEHAPFFVRQWIGSTEASPVVRELQALGDVLVGMCSSWEFC